VNHAFAKELLIGFAGAEVDKLVETKGADHWDREKYVLPLCFFLSHRLCFWQFSITEINDTAGPSMRRRKTQSICMMSNMSATKSTTPTTNTMNATSNSSTANGKGTSCQYRSLTMAWDGPVYSAKW
jgi:hypothetical protein